MPLSLIKCYEEHVQVLECTLLLFQLRSQALVGHELSGSASHQWSSLYLVDDRQAASWRQNISRFHLPRSHHQLLCLVHDQPSRCLRLLGLWRCGRHPKWWIVLLQDDWWLLGRLLLLFLLLKGHVRPCNLLGGLVLWLLRPCIVNNAFRPVRRWSTHLKLRLNPLIYLLLCNECIGCHAYWRSAFLALSRADSLQLLLLLHHLIWIVSWGGLAGEFWSLAMWGGGACWGNSCIVGRYNGNVLLLLLEDHHWGYHPWGWRTCLRELRQLLSLENKLLLTWEWRDARRTFRLRFLWTGGLVMHLYVVERLRLEVV